MKIFNKKPAIKKFLLMTLGSLIYACAIACFLDPNKLIPGGVSGISIMINHLVSWVQTGTVIIVLTRCFARSSISPVVL
jgi:uncharacterized membrane-anchored protein YitT (DUF2179 family)